VLAASLNIDFELTGNFLGTEGQRAGMVLLLSMLLSFGFIRMSTRLMRSPRVPWWPGSVQTGGLHIHHLVFGIVLMMLAGVLGFTLQPGSPLTEILAAAFGIGMGLTIDEFALWLHLEDVYWAEEGRRSVDAMIVATIIAGGFALGIAPLSVGDSGPTAVVMASIVLHLAICIVVALKGKAISTLIGIFVPPVAYVTAIRLARPGSWWAKRRYARGSDKLKAARTREKRRAGRLRGFQDLVGGKPSA
jgi:lysyl-tRNA synthetase class 2